MSLQSSGSSVGVLKQKKGQAFDLSAFPPTPVYQGYEKPLPVNGFVPFLDKCVLQRN